jgi:transposase
VLEARGDDLAAFVELLKARCVAAGHKIARVILTHEAGRDGFWLARFLVRRGVEVHVIQPSSLPVDRRARRAKTDIIDVEIFVRTLMAWLRGEPRVCSMAPIPSEADEEARRAYREREDLTEERRSTVNKIDAILATLGAKGFKALRRDRRKQLASLRQPDGDPAPQRARGRIERLLDRRALGGYVGLGGTPFSSGGSEREQGIGKDGNRRRRLHASMVELAWMWLRRQPDSALYI